MYVTCVGCGGADSEGIDDFPVTNTVKAQYEQRCAQNGRCMYIDDGDADADADVSGFLVVAVALTVEVEMNCCRGRRRRIDHGLDVSRMADATMNDIPSM